MPNAYPELLPCMILKCGLQLQLQPQYDKNLRSLQWCRGYNFNWIDRILPKYKKLQCATAI